MHVVVVVWIGVAALLLWVELHTQAFFAAFAAVGCLGGAVVAAVRPDDVALQLGVAVVLAGVGVLALRPYVKKRFEHHSDFVPVGVHGGLVGQVALTLDEVGDISHVGHAQLAGERWLALSHDGTTIASGRKVTIVEVRGTTLVVEPLAP